jgi:hypothetical protein
MDFRTLAEEAVELRIGFIIHDYPFQARPLVLSGVSVARG